MKHFPEKIYDMRGNNNGLYRVPVVWCFACRQQWGEGSWVEGMKGYEKAHQATYTESLLRAAAALARIKNAVDAQLELERAEADEDSLEHAGVGPDLMNVEYWGEERMI